MALLVATLLLGACADELVNSDTAEIGGRCDNSTSSLCHYDEGWCTEEQICRSYCSIVNPPCEDGERPETSHTSSGISWTCVCVPVE
jgi:hypothetical protein